MFHTYPISVVLGHAAVVVVGGGTVAERKIAGLLSAGATISIIAPHITSGLKQLVDEGACIWHEKSYDDSDLDNASLVFACTNDEAVNKWVFEDASSRKLLVNVADRPELCTFYLPSVLRRGPLSIAVSTEGASPLSARKIREGLEEHFDDAIADYLLLLQEWRGRVSTGLAEEKRSLFWEQASSGEVYRLVEASKHDEANKHLAKLFDELSGK